METFSPSVSTQAEVAPEMLVSQKADRRKPSNWRQWLCTSVTPRDFCEVIISSVCTVLSGFNMRVHEACAIFSELLPEDLDKIKSNLEHLLCIREMVKEKRGEIKDNLERVEQ